MSKFCLKPDCNTCDNHSKTNDFLMGGEHYCMPKFAIAFEALKEKYKDADPKAGFPVEEVDAIDKSFDPHNCQYFRPTEYDQPNMILLNSFDDYFRLYIMFSAGNFNTSDGFSKNENEGLGFDEALESFVFNFAQQNNCDEIERCFDDDGLCTNPTLLKSTVINSIKTQTLDNNTTFPAVAYIQDENAYDRVGSSSLKIFVVKSITNMHSFNDEGMLYEGQPS